MIGGERLRLPMRNDGGQSRRAYPAYGHIGKLRERFSICSGERNRAFRVSRWSRNTKWIEVFRLLESYSGFQQQHQQQPQQKADLRTARSLLAGPPSLMTELYHIFNVIPSQSSTRQRSSKL